MFSASRLPEYLYRLIVFAGIVLAYQLLALRAGNATLFPTLSELVAAYPSFALFAGSQPDVRIASWVLLLNTLQTLGRIAVGSSTGIAAGTVVGLAMQFLPAGRSESDLLLAFARSIPLFALVPLFIYWNGTGETGIYGYIAFAIFVIVATNASEAVRNTPSRYPLQGRLLGAGRLQLFVTVYAPAAAPELAAGIRTAIGWSWAFSLGAEYIAANSGLGFLAYRSYLYSDMGKLVILAGIYVLLGWGTDTVLTRVLRPRGWW